MPSAKPKTPSARGWRPAAPAPLALRRDRIAEIREGKYPFDTCRAVTDPDLPIAGVREDVLAAIIHAEGDLGRVADTLGRRLADVEDLVMRDETLRSWWREEFRKKAYAVEQAIYSRARAGDMKAAWTLFETAPDEFRLNHWRKRQPAPPGQEGKSPKDRLMAELDKMRRKPADDNA